MIPAGIDAAFAIGRTRGGVSKWLVLKLDPVEVPPSIGIAQQDVNKTGRDRVFARLGPQHGETPRPNGNDAIKKPVVE